MSEPIFKKVDYYLKDLISNIALGQIGLPDIQRPFVWKNTKARDLFDSMYRGYPIGYLLFWETGHDTLQQAKPRNIGADIKQIAPQLMVVDGQQRLTSLYSVIRGMQVVRDNYESERIRIAFNPLEEKFEVTSAAIERDKVYIPDISLVWSSTTNIFHLVDEYLSDLSSSRTVSSSDTEKVQNSFMRLKSLENFPLTALQLSASISEEDVAEVFVRINSQGKSLIQSDFILTLMSVFWDEGRTELEQFCRDSRQPAANGPSSFNYFIEPTPDQLLRVSVGLAFRRARLRYVYSLLRGKNLGTGEFSDQYRVDQFEVLKKAQIRTLNLQYWHDFMKCIHAAGFRSGKTIGSRNNLLFCYILYLIGRTECRIRESRLRQAIAQWFFMSMITRRYTSSPESNMEYDLAMLEGISGGQEFCAILRHICDITLTDDFWTVTLPNELANSSTTSPSLSGYEAAQVILEAPALFSNSKIGDLIDPAIHARTAAVERHHLFPKAYLSTLDISGARQVNQIGNLAYMERSENAEAADQSPEAYVSDMMGRFSEAARARMHYCHALPEGWEEMEYSVFLERRRELMAGVVREAYERLADHTFVDETPVDYSLTEIVSSGESDSIEFKSTMRVNLHTGTKDKRIEETALKTLAGFLNTYGGTLVIGVGDDGTPVGIGADQFPNEDRMSLHLVNLVKGRMGAGVMTMVHPQFDDYEDHRVLRVVCERSSRPVYVSNGDRESFFVRTGPATAELTGSQMMDYIGRRFSA
jgi:hypothetical protein